MLTFTYRFVQFHPTALADEGLPIPPLKTRENAFLITEAVRGDGGLLYNLDMERFMPMYDERAELAPRDVVARSIDDQLKKRNEKYVLLDISHKARDKILSHFPNIAAECLQYGLDITRDPIPVVPAAHYMCGGVRAGLQGETNVRGLYVAGEIFSSSDFDFCGQTDEFLTLKFDNIFVTFSTESFFYMWRSW